jgi:hypothetical protein
VQQRLLERDTKVIIRLVEMDVGAEQNHSVRLDQQFVVRVCQKSVPRNNEEDYQQDHHCRKEAPNTAKHELRQRELADRQLVQQDGSHEVAGNDEKHINSGKASGKVTLEVV